jgi:ABC-type polysaccharide/polyol phosphate export permease
MATERTIRRAPALEERLYAARQRPSWVDIATGRWLTWIPADLRRVLRYRSLVAGLTNSQLTVRYHRSVLGVLWTLLNPLLMLSVQAVAFSQILGMNIREYAVYLFSGLVVWQFFSAALDSGSRSLVSNEGYIKTVTAPKIVYPLVDLLVALTTAAFALAALILFALALGSPWQPQIVLLPVGIIFVVTFTFGLTLIAMTLVTSFRDFTHIISVLLPAYYFLCPILYPPSFAGGRAMLRYNPMSYFLEFVHDALIPARVLLQDPTVAGGLWPSATSWIVASLCSLISLSAGYIVYKMNEHDYIFRL